MSFLFRVNDVSIRSEVVMDDDTCSNSSSVILVSRGPAMPSDGWEEARDVFTSPGLLFEEFGAPSTLQPEISSGILPTWSPLLNALRYFAVNILCIIRGFSFVLRS